MISFSKQVKEELLIAPVKNTNTVLSSIILSIGTIQFIEDDMILEVKSSNIALIRKTLMFLKQYDKNFNEKIIIRENKQFKSNNKVFIIEISNNVKEFLINLGIILPEQNGIFLNLQIPKYIQDSEVSIREFLRYLFVCTGSINNPKVQKQYHLEIICHNNILIEFTQKLTKEYDIHFKITTRKNISALYLNKSEEIADFLRLIGSIKNMFDFEDQRLMRDIRAFENRLINAEIANETKRNTTSSKQVNAILKLKEHGVFDKLKVKTQHIAQARLDNPNASLNELAQIFEDKFSKSNIRYHLNLIVDAAKNI